MKGRFSQQMLRQNAYIQRVHLKGIKKNISKKHQKFSLKNGTKDF